MRLPAEALVRTEGRALTHEVDQLIGREMRAVAMWAMTVELAKQCPPGASKEQLLAPPVEDTLQTLRDYVASTSGLRQQIAIEQGNRTRSYSLSPYEHLAQLTDMVSANAYFAYARASGRSPDYIRQHSGAHDGDMSHVMQYELGKWGVETQRMTWYEFPGNHRSLRAAMPDGKGVYIDPTWQQHLPEGADYSQHPHVLVAPTDRIVEILTAHGVPESRHHAWLDAEVSSSTEIDDWGWNPVLDEVFGDD